jgi:hypothetical protein
MKKIFFLSLFIVLALGSSSLKTEQGELMNILQNQPVFELKLDGFGAMYTIDINGVSVFEQDIPESQVVTRVPINHYMRSGENTISISTWSGDDEPINPHAHIKIELVVSEHNKPAKEFVVSTIHYDNSTTSEYLKTVKSSDSGTYSAKHNFTANEKGEVIVDNITFIQKKNVSEYTRRITIPSSLPLWSFFNSDDLPDYMSMSDEEYYQHMDVLFAEYLKVQNAITENNIDTILPMFEERNKELDLAFYNPIGTLAEKIKAAFIDAANDKSAVLAKLKRNNLNFYTSENKKLTRLGRGDGGGAVALNYNEISGSYSFDMIFRHKDGKWILTR